MFSISLILFVLACAGSHVFCLKKVICSLDDEICLTKAARNSHPLVTGLSGDPFNVDVINTDLPAIKYTLHNATFTGFKDCVVTKFSIVKANLTYIYAIQCPHLKTKAEYDVSGVINTVPMEGKGAFQSTHDNYEISFFGNYEKMIDDDKKLHIHLTDFILNLEAKGKVTYKYESLFGGDAKKSDEFHETFSKDNWKTVDKVLGDATMTVILHKFVKEIVNQHMTLEAFEDTFSYYE